MYPYITCLGVDGQIYRISQNAQLIFNERGIPIAWKFDPIPDIQLIAVVPETNFEKIEQHPLRKALFKYLAAKEHKIFEKQRPQDVTMDEALNMVRQALADSGVSASEIEPIVAKYFAS